MSLSLLLIASLAVAGNTSLWIVIWNRVQSTVMPLWLVAIIAHAAKACCIVVPPGLLAALWLGHGSLVEVAAQFYVGVCVVIAAFGIPHAAIQRWRLKRQSQPPRIRARVARFEIARQESIRSAGIGMRELMLLPGNQSFEIEINEKQFAIPKLPSALDGLKIAHLSDLHYTGLVAKSFFDHAVDLVNDMSVDLIAVTGDLVDRPACMSWVPATLGRLRARYGVFVILGNHDCKQNLPTLRLMLAEAGLTHLGGRLQRLTIHGESIVVAGNELPWIVPAPDMTQCPETEQGFRILLAHTPDQIDWAKHYGFDLMLAGHTHGGQFCLPWFGPVVCPSRLPLAYASGSLYDAPTHLHVSRGLSGWVPLRWNCRPEITQLTLRCSVASHQALVDTEKDARRTEKVLHLS